MAPTSKPRPPSLSHSTEIGKDDKFPFPCLIFLCHLAHLLFPPPVLTTKPTHRSLEEKLIVDGYFFTENPVFQSHSEALVWSLWGWAVGWRHVCCHMLHQWPTRHRLTFFLRFCCYSRFHVSTFISYKEVVICIKLSYCGVCVLRNETYLETINDESCLV